MNKIILAVTLVVLLFASPASAWMNVGAGDAYGILYYETFDNLVDCGDDSGNATNCSVGGYTITEGTANDVDFDVAGLTGTYAALVDGTSATASFIHDSLWPARSEVFIKMTVKFNTLSVANDTSEIFFVIREAAANAITVRIYNDNAGSGNHEFSMKHGAQTLRYGTYAVLAATQYWIWIHYIADTGPDDGVYDLWVNTSDDFATATLDLVNTDGQNEEDVTGLNFRSQVDELDVVFDEIKR
jgi:hypothetical protein